MKPARLAMVPLAESAAACEERPEPGYIRRAAYERPSFPHTLARRPPDPRADRAERRAGDERAGDRLVARGAAQGDGQERQPRRAMRARPRGRSGPLPVDGPERHHHDRHLRRRLFGRKPGRADRPAASQHSASATIPPIRVGFGIVIVLTTYVSLVIGEIVPKQIALRSPEPIAVVMSRPMRMLSKIVAPFVWMLDRSSALMFKLFGLDREFEEPRDGGGTASGRRRSADRRASSKKTSAQ